MYQHPHIYLASLGLAFLFDHHALVPYAWLVVSLFALCVCWTGLCMAFMHIHSSSLHHHPSSSSSITHTHACPALLLHPCTYTQADTHTLTHTQAQQQAHYTNNELSTSSSAAAANPSLLTSSLHTPIHTRTHRHTTMLAARGVFRAVARSAARCDIHTTRVVASTNGKSFYHHHLCVYICINRGGCVFRTGRDGFACIPYRLQ